MPSLAPRLDFRPDLDVDALFVDLTVEEAIERLREGARTKSDAKMGVEVVADLDGTFVLTNWRKEDQLQVTFHRLGDDACVVRMERRRKGLPLVPFFALMAALGLVPLVFGFVPLYLVWLAGEVYLLTPITHARCVAWVEETLGVPEHQRRGGRRENSFGWFDGRSAPPVGYRDASMQVRLPRPGPGLLHDVVRRSEDRGQFVRATVSFHPWTVRGLVAAHVLGVALLFTTRHLVLIGLVLACLRWTFRGLRGLDRHRLAEAG